MAAETVTISDESFAHARVILDNGLTHLEEHTDCPSELFTAAVVLVAVAIGTDSEVQRIRALTSNHHFVKRLFETSDYLRQSEIMRRELSSVFDSIDKLVNEAAEELNNEVVKGMPIN